MNNESYAVANSNNQVVEGRFATVADAEKEIARRLANEAPFAAMFATGPGYRVITAAEADTMARPLSQGPAGFSVEQS